MPEALTMPRKSADHLDWDASLRDFRSSGLSHVAFCQHRRTPLHAFRRRPGQARTSQVLSSSNKPPAVSAPAFLPVTVLPDPPRLERTAQWALQLILPHGRRVAVAPGSDSNTLRRPLFVLEAPPVRTEPRRSRVPRRRTGGHAQEL